MTLSVIVHVCVEALLIRGENLPLDGHFRSFFARRANDLANSLNLLLQLRLAAVVIAGLRGLGSGSRLHLFASRFYRQSWIDIVQVSIALLTTRISINDPLLLGARDARVHDFGGERGMSSFHNHLLLIL